MKLEELKEKINRMENRSEMEEMIGKDFSDGYHQAIKEIKQMIEEGR